MHDLSSFLIFEEDISTSIKVLLKKDIKEAPLIYNNAFDKFVKILTWPPKSFT